MFDLSWWFYTHFSFLIFFVLQWKWKSFEFFLPSLAFLPRSVTLLLLQHARTMGNDNAFFICRLEMNSDGCLCVAVSWLYFAYIFISISANVHFRMRARDRKFEFSHRTQLLLFAVNWQENLHKFTQQTCLFSEWLISFNSLRLIISHSLCKPSDRDWHSTWVGWRAVDKTT